MSWRCTQAEARARHLARFDAAGVEDYDALAGTLSREDEDACLADLSQVIELRSGLSVLDAGAGTGALCGVLARVAGLAITALEPVPGMLDRLRARDGLQGVAVVEGFCDSLADRPHFGEAEFDVVVSRQLANGLYDPLAAFGNWHHWLKPGGAAVVIDGIYGRDAWTGPWREDVDVLPLAACQGRAALPYLLERAGLAVVAMRWMDAVNRRPSTRTPRYVIAARKP